MHETFVKLSTVEENMIYTALVQGKINIKENKETRQSFKALK